ncbi:CocE/NonD family hydrolase [Arhodomonas sp. SL1]|uniref:CocE/NonD family hydrolase n=1 Tax=Arhodomonas sp. SL1 TaxID=3425691 RepID=UPI003F8826E1
MRIARELPCRVQRHETLWIPMGDGARLAARLWLPEGAERAPVPAILEYIPYRRRDAKRERDERMHGYFAAHGYACLRVDMRGSGDSDGVLRDEYLEQELIDGGDILAWIADQPWCDGRVGMIGISWGGFNGLQLAARRPPQLGAVIAVCASDDRYADDVHYMGGCLLNDNLSWAATMFAYNSMPPDPAVVGDRWREMWHQRLEGSGLWVAEWMRHPHRDDYWRHASVCEDYGAIQVPVLSVSGWADGYSNPVFRLVENLRAPVKGLIGPWSHMYPHEGRPGPEIGFLQECLRWWDHWLKGEDTGADREPALRVWMQSGVEPRPGYDHRPGRWVAEAEWPSPNVTRRPWRLSPAKALIAPHEEMDERCHEGDPVTIQSPLRVGLFGGKWCSYGAAPDHPYDQREEDGGSLVFDTQPIESTLEILGAPEVELELASDRPVAMVALRLSDIAPDDKATRVTYGLLNLCHRDSHSHPEPLEPGRRYRVRISLNGCAHRFARGHRLRLALSTSYWPLAWAPPEPVHLSVWAIRSRLLLPVHEPAPDVAPHDVNFHEAEAAEPPHLVTLDSGEDNWFVNHDLKREESTLHVIADEGRKYLSDIDLTLTKHAEEWYRTRGHDFTSPDGEVVTVRSLARGDWQVRTETRTLLSCDAENFYVHATLDAWEGRRRVFNRIWNETIPRGLL